MQKPYVGITDFTSAREAEDMRQLLLAHRENQDRLLMVGVMMSYKTLNGLPTKWAGVFPRPDDIQKIFLPGDGLLNTLHYADYEGINVWWNLEKAVSYGGPNMHALQLDMIWPDPRVIRCHKTRHPSLQIILQANKNALAAVGEDPAKFIEKLREYEGALDYVLLDKSGGLGLGMDAQGLLPYARALRDHLPEIGIAAAGGLGPTTMAILRPLAREFPGISIDAQGKLRPSGNAIHPIDWLYAEDYLVTALKMLDRQRDWTKVHLCGQSV